MGDQLRVTEPDVDLLLLSPTSEWDDSGILPTLEAYFGAWRHSPKERLHFSIQLYLNRTKESKQG